MLQLHAKLNAKWDADPMVLRIVAAPHFVGPEHECEAVLIQPNGGMPAGFPLYLRIGTQSDSVRDWSTDIPVHTLPESLGYLSAGDIIAVQPRSGDLWVVYRRGSRSNSMLVTERCNSRCVMCSQPPKEADDSHLVETWLRAIPLMDPATPELGITGGEPTLLGPRLIDLMQACKAHLPQTALHMLSNGRLFAYLSLAQELAAVEHPDLMVGIPIYSDIASQHDFVVQAKGAFDQTLRGIMNLERCGVSVELRVVLHRQTIDRLPGLARYITRNLPFVDHVALMGLEMMGYVRMNLDSLWIDPFEYQQTLTEAVRVLTAHRLNVSIYNHQLCTLPRELWPYARQSISDWKNEYLDVCEPCNVRDQCGGFFSSAKIRFSDHIQPVTT